MGKKKKKARVAGQEEQGRLCKHGFHPHRAGLDHRLWSYWHPGRHPPQSFPWRRLPLPLAPWFSHPRASFLPPLHFASRPPPRTLPFIGFQQRASPPFIHPSQGVVGVLPFTPPAPPAFRNTRQGIDVANAARIPPHAPLSRDSSQDVTNGANTGFHSPLHAPDTWQDVAYAENKGIQVPIHDPISRDTQQDAANAASKDNDICVQPHAPEVTIQQNVTNAANKDVHMPLHAPVVMDIQQDAITATNEDVHIPPHTPVFMDTQQGFATSLLTTAKKEAQPNGALAEPAEEKNVDGSKCFEVKKAPLKRKRGMSKASKSALLPAIEEEDIEQPAEQKNVDGLKCIVVKKALLKRKRSKSKASKSAVTPAFKKEDREQAVPVPSKEVFSVQIRLPSPEEMIARVEKAATKAHKKLLAQGKAVLVLDVVRESLRSLGYTSLESISLCMYDVPCLHKLIKLEAKLNMLIACHVAVRKITTLHDLREEILSSENVKSFDELRIGPLSLHPLVIQLFAPPQGSKICRITAVDVLNYLTEYLNKYADDSLSDSKVEGFLSYIVKRKSLPSAAHLSVRIENFGLYASYILRETKVSVKPTSYKKSVSACTEIAEVKLQGTNETSVKKAQNGSIARQRPESFPIKVIESSKHTVFVSSDEEYAEENISSKLAWSRRDALTSDQLHSSNCPYPSITEERLRLLAKIPSEGNEELQEYSLSNRELREFIRTWREICLSSPIDEVLTRILVSGAHMDAFKNWKKKISKKQQLLKSFKLYPAIGILNVAVLFVKSSHRRSFLDAYEETPNNQIERTKNDDTRTILEISADQKAFNEHDTSEEQPARSSEQVLEEVIRILHEMNTGTIFGLREQGMLDEQGFCTMVRRIMCFEKDLVSRLLIKRFSDLRLGCFPDFIEVHWNRIQNECSELYKNMARKMLYGNGVSEERVQSFLSQVKMAVGDGECLPHHDSVMQLFSRQFSLHHVGNWCSSIVRDLNVCLKGDGVPGCSFIFSFALLATKANNTHGAHIKCIRAGQDNDLVEALPMPQAGMLGSITSADAKHCLVKAPMLCDLLKWSQWESVFFPILGSFPNWLERECPIEGLICLATSDGKYLRIDGTSTVDTFLAAMAKGCGKQAALQFVSVMAVYGGVDRVPLALLKSYSHRALEILLVEKPNMAAQIKRKVSVSRNHRGINAFEEGVSFMKSDPFHPSGEDEPCNKYRGVIHFVFDMLAHLPSEFVVFAASIVVSALLKIVPDDVTAAMLRTYGTADHFMSLHEIGLSLGVTDWVSNFQSLFLPLPVSFVETRMEVPVLEKQVEENIRLVSGEDEASFPSNCFKNVACKNDTATTDGDSGVQDQIEFEKEASEVIAIIRKEEFGMDMNLSSEESHLLAKQHARIGRALQCLSEELYSQDTHFVLELVQNADDNQYAHGVEASLVFILESQRFVVVNNELGFTPANIRALCDVGSSTKPGSCAGYIGHKGIGFKSVFCVSDAPEVHSRGFHVKFDISEGNIGFILPTTIPPFTNWELIEEVLTATQAFKEQKSNSNWNTCLLIPLKPSIQDGPNIQTLSTKLNDIQPSLLLFLHRLERIIIRNDLTGTLRVLQRCNSDNGLVRISDGTSSAIWLVVKQQFDALVERPGVKTTEIALAFPVREVSRGVYEACNEHQQVFAFLPLRSYGLRFIIQGDFILPSSQEELDVDSAWNQWLFSEVPSVFVEIVEALKELACFKEIPGKSASLFLSFIPLEGEVQGFFSSLPGMILARLRASQCLPVDAKENEWVLPCVLLGGWTNSSKTLIPDQLLREHLGLYYLHRDVVVNPAVACGLGIHMYGTRMLINFIESVCSSKDALQALGPRWISSWFVALQKCAMSEAQGATYFSQPRFESENIEKLKHIPCIPLSNGTYTSLEEGTVWLPCIDTDSVDDAATLLEDFPLIYSELRTVHALMLDPMDFEVNQSNPTTCSVVEKEECKSLIFSMLYQLGVLQLSGHELMTNHILSSMASDDFLGKPKPLVVQYLTFVMVHLQSTNCKQCKVDRSNIISQLKRIAVIATKDGLRRVNAGFLHFGAEFDCNIHVKKLLQGLQVRWAEIDPAYLEAYKGLPGRASLSQWRQFFKDLGVTDFVSVVRKPHDKANNFRGEVDVAVCDWECPELVTILEHFCSSDLNLPNKNSKLSRLISAFDSLWDECYSKYSAICWSDGREKKMTREKTVTSFVSQMRSFAWVPSSFDLKLYQPSQLYYRCSAVESILGMHAPYPISQISCISFAEALGFKVNVYVPDVLDLLRVWNGYPFKTSVSQMKQLYNFIWNGAAQHKEDIMAFFQKEACIFIPAKMKAKADAPCKGRFYPSNRLFWEDSTGALAKVILSKDASADLSVLRICPKALNTLYPTLRGFLVDICHIQATLGFDDYFSVLKILADYFPPKRVLPEVLAVLVHWSHDIDTSHVKPSEVCKWKELLQRKESRILPTLQDEWVSLDDSAGFVCWCDDEMLGEQFLDFKNVFYVCVSSDVGNASVQNGKLKSFFQAMSIPPLSKVIRREPIVQGVRWSKQLFDMLHWSLPYTQRYMRKWHGDIYDNLQKSAFVDRLKKIQCIHADRLFFFYKLPGEIGSGKEQFETEHLFQGDSFYATNLENLNSLYFEFSRIFFDGTTNLQLANFLHLVTLSSQSGSKESELEALLASQGIGPFPDIEKQWSLDCPSADGIRAVFDSQQFTQCFHVPDGMSKQGVDNANNTLPFGSWHQTRNNTSYKGQILSTINRVAACQKSLAAVMHQIEAKTKFKSKERQLEGEGQDTAPLFESSLVVPGKVASKNKDAPAMFEDVMVPLEEKSQASKDALDAGTESACDRADKSKKFTSIDANIEGPLVVTNPIPVLHGDNAKKLQVELAASNLVLMPEDTRLVNFSNREQMYFGHPSKQQVVLTGRLGEALVVNHLMEKYGPGCVSWMNVETESGLPYDIVVDGFCGQKLLVEVKTTCSEHKDWFEISNREWEYAAHTGERFVIIRVFLGGHSGSARFVWLPNPIKLCQEGMVKLALIVPQ